MKYWIDRGLWLMGSFYGIAMVGAVLINVWFGAVVIVVGGVLMIGWYYLATEAWVDQVLSNLDLHEQVQRITNPDQFERWEDWAAYRPDEGKK